MITPSYRYKEVLQCLQHKRGDGDRQHRGLHNACILIAERVWPVVDAQLSL